MANLNLSQFGEKLFVADADHTFIWDTAASISKRVSRNSWLNSGTLTADAPVTISQTWNNAAVAFTGLKFNADGASNANSAAASKLLDLQINGASRFSVEKDKVNLGTQGYYSNSGNSPRICSTAGLPLYLAAGGDVAAIGFTVKPDLSVQIGGYNDGCRFYKDGNHQLGLRDGSNGQTFSVYGTYPGAAWERFTITAPTSGNVLLGTYKGTGGIARGLELQTDGVTRMTIATNGAATFSGPVTGFNIIATNYIGVPAGNGFIPNLGASFDYLKFSSNGGSELARVGYFGTTATSYLSFGGVANTSPALKRSSTTIQARLADDSAFTNIQGKLTTDTAFTSGAITDTGYIVLYDSTGTAYKVACTPV